jgi:hypothetical protein
MSRTGWISLAALGLLALGPRGGRAQDDYMMLDEMSIKGQVREPAVAIISSRLQPEIQGFRLEKSFFDQVRTPDEELVSLDRGMVREERVKDREALLARARVLPSASWPLKGSAPAADQGRTATEGQSGK